MRNPSFLSFGVDFFVLLWYTITRVHDNTILFEVIALNDRNLVNLTVTMTREELKALRQIALDNDMSVSALIRLWLKDYQVKEAKEEGR